jgi:NADPH:quinone reductase-like Zn-dependent oxidoreductase
MRLYRLPRQTGFDDLTLAEAETPHCGRGQVLVRMHAASLNFRDLSVATGRYVLSALPPNLVPLSDGAGEVVEIGAEVTRVKAGDRVAGIFMQGWLGGELEPGHRHTAARSTAYSRSTSSSTRMGWSLSPIISPTSRQRRCPARRSRLGTRSMGSSRCSRARRC